VYRALACDDEYCSDMLSPNTTRKLRFNFPHFATNDIRAPIRAFIGGPAPMPGLLLFKRAALSALA
jgi:hypothetical protein